jgi:toxin ParE1/3/4
MANDKPVHYALTPQALMDMEAIWSYTPVTSSVEQADAYSDDLAQLFDMIVATPAMAREYREFSPPVRIHAHRSHVVVYMIERDRVLIVRILGGRQDWRTIHRSIEP